MEDVEDIEAWLAAARAGCSDKDLAELGLTVPKETLINARTRHTDSLPWIAVLAR